MSRQAWVKVFWERRLTSVELGCTEHKILYIILSVFITISISGPLINHDFLRPKENSERICQALRMLGMLGLAVMYRLVSKPSVC